MKRQIGYYIEDGIEYPVFENSTSEELGEHQDREYPKTERIINKTFEFDNEI